jgi:hypothetical protein
LFALTFAGNVVLARSLAYLRRLFETEGAAASTPAKGERDDA